METTSWTSTTTEDTSWSSNPGYTSTIIVDDPVCLVDDPVFMVDGYDATKYSPIENIVKTTWN